MKSSSGPIEPAVLRADRTLASSGTMPFGPGTASNVTVHARPERQPHSSARPAALVSLIRQVPSQTSGRSTGLLYRLMYEVPPTSLVAKGFGALRQRTIAKGADDIGKGRPDRPLKAPGI
jgi:hypothetical protein